MPTYVISAADWSVPERRPKPGSTIKMTPDTSFKIVLNGVVAALLQAWDFGQDIWTTSFDEAVGPLTRALDGFKDEDCKMAALFGGVWSPESNSFTAPPSGEAVNSLWSAWDDVKDTLKEDLAERLAPQRDAASGDLDAAVQFDRDFEAFANIVDTFQGEARAFEDDPWFENHYLHNKRHWEENVRPLVATVDASNDETVEKSVDEKLESSTLEFAMGKRKLPGIQFVDDVKAFYGAEALTTLNVQMPKIAIVGAESSGKSTLIQALTGYRIFPTSAGRCTAMPLEMRVRRVDDMAALKAKCAEVGGDETRHLKSGVLLIFEGTTGLGEPITPVACTQKEVFDKTAQLMDELKQARPECPFSTETVVVTLYSPSFLVDLTFVDLPGITVNDRQGERGVPDATKAITKANIDSNTLVVVLVEAYFSRVDHKGGG